MNLKSTSLALASLPLVAASLSAQVYIANRYDNNVVTSTNLSSPSGTFSNFVTGGLGANSRGVETVASGDIVIAVNGQNLRRYNSAGVLQATAADTSALGNAKLAYNADDGILYANNGSTFRYSAAFTGTATGTSIATSYGANDIEYANFSGSKYLYLGGTGAAIRRYALSADGLSVSASVTNNNIFAGTFSGAALAFDNSGRGVAAFSSATSGNTAAGIYFYTNPTAAAITSADFSQKIVFDTTKAADATGLNAGAVADIEFEPTSIGATSSVVWLSSPSTNRIYRYSIDWTGGTMAFLDSFLAGSGGQNLQLAFAPIPEPSAFATLAALGGLGLAATRRRRA